MKKRRILFIIENDLYPDDIRVYNETKTLSELDGYECSVLAPRRKGQTLFEKIDKVNCYRFLHFDSFSTIGLALEYFIAGLWFLFYVPIIVIRRRINAIHIANPPDFIIILFYWLRLFGVKMIFDHHDLSLMVIKGKFTNQRSIILRFILFVHYIFEWIILKLATTVVASNNSIRDYDLSINSKADVTVVRNSSWIQFNAIKDVPKSEGKKLHLGYFGVILADRSAGLDNFIYICKILKDKKVDFSFTIIGDGPGLVPLKKMAKDNNLMDVMSFEGYVEINKAYAKIVNFDFGILPWPNIPKNNLLSAIKVMNYMCCAVPVCSLNLKEQLITTNNIGIHTDDFDAMVEGILSFYKDKKRYEKLREDTLDRFNKALSWEGQEKNLISVYDRL